MTVDEIFSAMDPRPKYDSQYDGLFNRFARVLRRNQLYMIAFMIGIHLDKCNPITRGNGTKDVYPLNLWSPRSQRDAVYYLLLKRSNKWRIPFEWKNLDNADDELFMAFKQEFGKAMDGFANAGLEYIQTRVTDDPTYFNQPFALIDLLVEVAESNTQGQQ